jgi:hypothetical protein
VISTTLNNVNQGELQKYEDNYKYLNLVTAALGKNVYNRFSHLKTIYDV